MSSEGFKSQQPCNRQESSGSNHIASSSQQFQDQQGSSAHLQSSASIDQAISNSITGQHQFSLLHSSQGQEVNSISTSGNANRNRDITGEFVLDQPLPKRARLHQQNNINLGIPTDSKPSSGRGLNTESLPFVNAVHSTNRRSGNRNFIQNLLANMEERQAEKASANSNLTSTTIDIPVLPIPNVENKPSPRDFPEFIANPYEFHPSFEFIQNTFVEVSACNFFSYSVTKFYFRACLFLGGERADTMHQNSKCCWSRCSVEMWCRCKCSEQERSNADFRRSSQRQCSYHEAAH